MINVEQEVDARIAGIEPPGIEVDPAARQIAIRAIEGINLRYGEHSENPLDFHNAPHSLDVMDRTIRLANLLYEFIPPKYKPNIYNLGVTVPATHDFEQMLGPGVNEIASADYFQDEIEQTGDSPINNEWFIKRGRLGHFATEVAFAEDGKLIQVHQGKGEPDPFAFIVGFADINGIAMDGDKRMIRDATNLCFEINGGNPGAEKLYEFLLTQAAFLKTRLNDHHMKPLIKYYFPDQPDEVYEAMHNAFHKNIISAYRLASLFRENPKLYSKVDQVMAGLDRVHAGAVVGKLLKSL